MIDETSPFVLSLLLYFISITQAFETFKKFLQGNTLKMLHDTGISLFASILQIMCN